MVLSLLGSTILFFLPPPSFSPSEFHHLRLTYSQWGRGKGVWGGGCGRNPKPKPVLPPMWWWVKTTAEQAHYSGEFFCWAVDDIAILKDLLTLIREIKRNQNTARDQPTPWQSFHSATKQLHQLWKSRQRYLKEEIGNHPFPSRNIHF